MFLSKLNMFPTRKMKFGHSHLKSSVLRGLLQTYILGPFYKSDLENLEMWFFQYNIMILMKPVALVCLYYNYSIIQSLFHDKKKNNYTLVIL